MIRNIFYLWVGVIFLTSCNSGNSDDNKYLETSAIETFDRMSKSVGELNSCSFMLQISSDTYLDTVGVVGHEAVSDVYMRGPNKMYIHTNSDRGSRGYWYDGNTLAWFNYDESVFDTLPAPETILQTINSAHENYGVDFPAADFFYSTFTDDMINQFDSIFYVGKQKVEEEYVSEILAVNNNMMVRIWIADKGNQSYPVGFLMTKKKNGEDLYYNAEFSHWIFNPVLPDVLFEFAPPTDAIRKPIQPLN